MNKVTNSEMIEFLLATEKKYLYLINDIKKSELPTAFKSECYIYKDGNDFVLIFHLDKNSAMYNVEVVDDRRIEEFYDIVMNNSKKEYLIMTQNKDLFAKEKFIDLFGELNYSKSSNYIAFKSSSIGNDLESRKNHIRLLTPEDEQFVLNFDSDERVGLKRSFDRYLINKFYLGMIYGYFIDDELGGYLSANSIDDIFWDVEYIYTLEKYRGQKIGTIIANFYLNDIIGRGGIASYGSAENDASVKVALNAGFEPYDETYTTSWIKD